MQQSGSRTQTSALINLDDSRECWMASAYTLFVHESTASPRPRALSVKQAGKVRIALSSAGKLAVRYNDGRLHMLQCFRLLE